MELVSGRSLACALPSGSLPLERVLTIGIAIAEAISAAHQKGITHRDLKPANIILGEGEHAGRIKVARLRSGQDDRAASAIVRRDADQAIANSPTFTSPTVTQHGLILGTARVHVSRTSRGKSSRRADRTSSRSASCSTRWPPGSSPSPARPACRSSRPFSRTPRGPSPRSTPRSRRTSRASSARPRQGSRAPVPEREGPAQRSRGPSRPRFESSESSSPSRPPE